MLITAEYAVWLLPAIYIFAAVYKSAQETGKAEGIGFITTGIVAATAATTMKSAVIYYFPSKPLIGFTIGNSLLFLSYLAILEGVKKEVEKYPKPPVRSLAYIALLVTFVALTVFKKNVWLTLDLAVYALAVSFVIISVEATAFGLLENKHKTAYIVFGISLISDFVIKGLVETFKVMQPQFYILLGMTLRIVAAVSILFLLKYAKTSVEKKIKTKEILPIIRRFLKKSVLVISIFSVAFGLFAFVSVYAFQYTIKDRLELYSKMISADASDTANNFRDTISVIITGLDTLSGNIETTNAESTKKQMAFYYERNKDNIAGIILINKSDKVIFTYPETGFAGNLSTYEKEAKKVFKTFTPAIYGPITSARNYPVLAVYVPMFRNGRFDGVISALFDLRRISALVTKSVKEEKILMVSKNGTIIYAPETDLIFKKTFGFFPEHPECGKIQNSTLGKGLLVKKTINPIPGSSFYVYAFMPERAVMRRIFPGAVYIIILSFIFMLIFIFALKALYDIFHKESKILFETLDRKSEESKTLSERLSDLVSLFADIHLELSVEEASRKLLKTGLKIIKNGNAGSILIKYGDDKFVYTAAEGFTKKIKGKFLTKEEVMMSIKKKPFIIRHIYDKMLKKTGSNVREEVKKMLKECGSEQIKSTIEAPLIVDGEYYGGIFIDSFISEEAFSREDLKIAEALSKLGSIFIKAKLAYDREREKSAFDAVSLNLYHKAEQSYGKDSILKVSFGALKAIYGNKLHGVSLVKMSKNKATIVKFDGNTLKISETKAPVATNERNSKFVNGTEEQPAFATILTGIPNIPEFCIILERNYSFKKEEKEFLKRVGRETANLYKANLYEEELKTNLANYIISIGKAIDMHSSFTEQHSLRVGYLAIKLGEKVNLSDEDMFTLVYSAILHDVGKIGIPNTILEKTGNLSKEELKMVQTHPEKGEKIIAPINPEAAKIIRHHHENWDGTGYPDKLKGNEIPFLSRIISIVDVFDALLRKRPYKGKLTFEKAMEEIKVESGRKFDPELLKIFVSLPKDTLIEEMSSEEYMKTIKKVIVEKYRA